MRGRWNRWADWAGWGAVGGDKRDLGGGVEMWHLSDSFRPRQPAVEENFDASSRWTGIHFYNSTFTLRLAQRIPTCIHVLY